MDKQSTGKSSLQRTYSMDLTKRSDKRLLESSRSFNPLKRAKFQHQEILERAAKDHNLTKEAMQDIKERGIRQQDMDIKGKSVRTEEDKKAIYKISDEKLQISSDQGKSENVENQGQTVLEKRDDELNRESKQLVLRWDHLMNSIEKQSQFLRKAESSIWKSNELTLEQKREYTHSLEMKNKEYVRTMRPTGQYLMGQLWTVAHQQGITNHLKKRSEGNSNKKS